MTAPNQLVSLLYMLRKYPSLFSLAALYLHEIEVTLEQADLKEVPRDYDIESLEYVLPKVTELATELEMDAVLLKAQRMAGYVKAHVYTERQRIYDDVKDLGSRLEDQLGAKWFMYVPQKSVEYYNKPALFGQQVNDNFPKANDDIRNAGDCLALGQNTACVMHLMRVMEVGLHALAKDLKIGYAPSWESYLKKIEEELKVKHSARTAWWKKHGPFYRDLSGDLVAVKNAWRNPTMHIEKRYDQDEATLILKSVEAFMRRMSTKLKS
jgi:hypothetical protein